MRATRRWSGFLGERITSRTRKPTASTPNILAKLDPPTGPPIVGDGKGGRSADHETTADLARQFSIGARGSKADIAAECVRAQAASALFIADWGPARPAVSVCVVNTTPRARMNALQ